MGSYGRERFPSVDPNEVEPGRYPVKVVESDIGPWSERNHDERWQLTLEITTGRYQGRRLWWRAGMSEAATPFRRGAVKALGIEWRDREVDLRTEVIGHRAIAEVVYNDDYDRAEVKRLRSVEQTAPGQTSLGDLPQDRVSGRNDDDIPPF